ncbi:hypothetical protein REPUB_Repub01dG0162900 [Reevesia pubescens]
MVLQALSRLKGASNNRKEKMSAETKHVFDQLTEDAMKLMENGDYNVYHEKKEVFQHEAALARGKGISANIGLDNSDPNLGSNILTDVNSTGVISFVLPDSAVGTSNSNLTAAEVSSNVGDAGDAQNEYVYDESSGYPLFDPSLPPYAIVSKCTTTVALWDIIMTHLQDHIVQQHQGNGNVSAISFWL